MEGTYYEVPVKKEYKTAQLQFQLEEDINIPEMKPDLDTPIAQKWNVLVKDVKVGNGKVCVEGEVEYLILYAREDAAGRLEVLNGLFPFNQCLLMEGVDKNGVDVKLTVTGEQVRKRNNRKLSVLLTIEMEAKKEGIHVHRFMEDTSEEVEKKLETFEAMRLCQMGTETVPFKEIVSLPSNRPDIGRILMDSVQLRGVEVRVEDGRFAVKGEAFLFVIYESGEENPRIQFMEISVPLEQEIACNACKDGLMLEYSYCLGKADLTAGPNEDGEERDFSIHLEMELRYTLKEKSKCQFLDDAYSLHEKVVPVRDEMEIESFCKRHSMRLRVNEMFVPPLEEKLLQVIPIRGEISTIETEVNDGSILLEGMLYVDLLYLTASPLAPPRVGKVHIPFHQQMEDVVIKKETSARAMGDIVQLSVNIIDSGQAEIKAAINLNIYQSEKKVLMAIVGLEEHPLEQNNEPFPGMVGYVVGPEDSLWNLAKENRTTVECIRKMNKITAEELVLGEKIVICRSL